MNLTAMVGANNRLSGFGYTTDSAGNIIADGVHTFTFDAENHLLSTAQSGQTTVNYTYDGDGKRVLKSDGTVYWYDEVGQLLADKSYSYYYLNGKRIARRNSANEVDFFVTDALGSARFMFSTQGASVSDFYPFGGERVVTAGGAPTNFKFTGKERDPESGLDNFLARFDSSTLGRFMSPDPTFESSRVRIPQAWNRYTYALNDPLTFTDPDGRLWQQSMNGTWDWMDKCNAGSVCVTEIAQQQGENVVVYGPSSAKDKMTFNANKDGYVNLKDIAATDGAYFEFQSGVTATYASPQTAVDLYNGAFDYRAEYPQDAKLSLNDVGRANGAPFSPHKTHNLGRAFDTSYVGPDGKAIHRGDLGVWLADDIRMKALVRIFRENGFNQNYSDNTDLGVNYAPGHKNHIHFGKSPQVGQCEIGPCP